jgi:site-specific DNA-adenine methylase
MPNCAFNYSGSKSDYAELHSISEPVVDLFGGGGGFWSRVASDRIVVNDSNRELVLFQRLVHIVDDRVFENLVSKLYQITAGVDSRESYEALRARFNAEKNEVLFYALLSCCTNNMIRYNKSGGFNQTWGRRKFNESMEKKLREFRDRIRGKRIDFVNMDFRQVPHYSDRPLYFVDPPYIISGNTYGIWTEKDEHDLYAYLQDKRFAMTNYMIRGSLTNNILVRAIDSNKWNTAVLRTGQMRAQRDNSTFTELLVCDSDETARMFNLSL